MKLKTFIVRHFHENFFLLFPVYVIFKFFIMLNVITTIYEIILRKRIPFFRQFDFSIFIILPANSLRKINILSLE